jgi:hypothetical protein
MANLLKGPEERLNEVERHQEMIVSGSQIARGDPAIPGTRHCVHKIAEIVTAPDGRPVAKPVSIPGKAPRQAGSWRAAPAWTKFGFEPSLFAQLNDDELREEGWPE